jgi:SAM-dependent methyltransferase
MRNPFNRHLPGRIRNRLGLPMSGHLDYVNALEGKRGLEIGGPSNVFVKQVPVYRRARAVDQLNFSADTVWTANAAKIAMYSMPSLERGKTIILDGTDLRTVPDADYDFVLSSHNLEHIANPLKALAEWIRVVRPGGHLLLIVPNKAGTFDHQRPFTTFEHVVDDLHRNVDEHDLTHLEEILSLHDLSKDPEAGSKEEFTARSLRNFENRCLHHHVFDIPLVMKMFAHLNLRVLKHAITPRDCMVLGQKP